MIKAILIIIALPSTWAGGSEQHIPFETMEECKEALSGVTIEKSIVYCTTPELETWRWPHLNPNIKRENPHGT